MESLLQEHSTQDQSGSPLWHSEDIYLATLARRSGLVEESRLFLLEYAKTGNIQTASDALVNGVLPQRSRATRAAIVPVIQQRLVQWHPPDWVLADLVTFAQDTSIDALRAALLLHTARQDSLFYDFVQQVVVPCWRSRTRVPTQASVHRFLDDAQEDRTEIQCWSRATREKLASNVLNTLRDSGLLKGTVQKSITLPIVPTPVVVHLVRLLRAEGVNDEHLAMHADWRLWLWDETWAQRAINEVIRLESNGT
jgi:hypothetical protein